MASLLLLLSACDQQDESGRVIVDGPQANMSFTPPTQLLSTRSIVRANLILEITIAGETSRVVPNVNGVYEFKTTRPANSSTTVTLVWSELIDGEPLPLARAIKTLNVGTSPTEPLRFSSSEFEFALYDEDEDGFDNYTERRDGDGGAFDDPLSPLSPPVFVTIDVRLSLPIGMRDATAARRAAVAAQAIVNSEEILLSRDGDVWTGSATVTENSEPLVTATFYATDDRRVKIASLARNQNIGGGGQAIFNEDDYEVDTFNDDGDAFTNIQETAIGSNPRDSSDPRAPVANAGADVSISSGATVTLNGSGSSSDSEGSIVKFRWIEGTRDLGTGVSLVVSGLGVGPHEIELRVTDDLGLTAADTVTVTVTAAPVPNQLPVASAGADQTIASGASVTLNAGDSSDPDGSISTYRWSENGVSKGTGQILVISNLSDGSHVITLLVTDNDGATDTDAVTINVTAAAIENQPPVADAGADQTIASGASVTVNGSGSSDPDGSISTYQWSENGVSKGTGQSLVINNLSDGSHLIALLVTDNAGATDTDTVRVNVTAAPIENKPPVANAGADQTIVSGESVTLNGSASADSDGTIDSFQWSEGGVLQGTGESLVINDLSVGEHVITLLVTDDDADTDTATVTITVTAAPDPDLPPEADAGFDQTIDSGDSVVLNGGGSSDPDGIITSFEWSEGLEILGRGVNLELSDLSDGQHVIKLLVTDDDELTDSDTVMVKVTAELEPDLPPMADAGVDQIIDSGDPVTLNGRGSSDPDGTIVSYEWSEGLEMLGTGVSLEISDLTDGEHEFTLLVTDDDELTDFATVSVEVTAAPEPDLPPMADAGIDQIINSGDSVTMNGSASTDPDGIINSYEWSLGTVSLGTGESLLINDLDDGSHEITLLVTDDDELTDSDTVSVTVTAAGETGDGDAPDIGRDNSVDGAKTSATGEFFAPMRRTLA